MKKVLLINTNTEKFPYPVAPVGLAYIAESLRGKYDISLFDSMSKSTDDLIKLVNNFRPDYIGFSLRNVDNLAADSPFSYIEKVYSEFIEPVKKITDVPKIIGGSGFSIFPVEILNKYGLDYGVIGEGESLFSQLLEFLDNNIKDFKLPGIITPTDYDFNWQDSANNVSYFNRYSGNIDLWTDFLPYKLRSAYCVQTKRGCPHKCIYCSYPLIEGSKYRFRDIVHVVDEIENANKRLGSVNFEFVDSVFNDPEDYAKEICREIISRNINGRFRTMGINPANTTKELLQLMVKAGFTQIDFTPDSASSDMLINLKKNFNIQQLRFSASLIRELNIPTMWFFIFGAPGENERTIDETFSFIENYIDTEDLVYLAYGLRIYPGTELQKIAVREGKLNPDTSLLNPEFYYPDELPGNTIKEILSEKAKKYSNCLLASKATPSPEMLQEAMKIRQSESLTEPMFRTLLRIRSQWRKEGKILD